MDSNNTNSNNNNNSNIEILSLINKAENIIDICDNFYRDINII